MQGIETLATRIPQALIPQHCEAYPSFTGAGVAKHVREDQPFCEWQDEFCGLAGQMDAEFIHDFEMHMLYSFGSDTYRHQRGVRFRVLEHRQFSGRMELRMHCPTCHKLSTRMFFKGRRWACQRCQGLVERRTLLSEGDKLILRRDKHNELVHAQRQQNMGRRKWERAREELIEINKVYDFAYAGEAVPTLRMPLRHDLSPRWFGAGEERTERELHDHGPAYLDLR